MKIQCTGCSLRCEINDENIVATQNTPTGKIVTIRCPACSNVERVLRIGNVAYMSKGEIIYEVDTKEGLDSTRSRE